MAVDALREKFHVSRVKASELGDFLSAQTYRPEILEAQHKVKSFKLVTLQGLCKVKIRQGPTPIYAETGDYCFKSKHIQGLLATATDGDKVDPIFSKENERFKIHKGDIVIARKGVGTIGRTSIFCGEKALNTDDLVFRAAIDHEDNRYVAAYLRSYLGERLLEAGVYGSTGQISLSTSHVRNLPIILIDSKAQKYIGKKVGEAEKLRAWSEHSIFILQEKYRQFYRTIDGYTQLKNNYYKVQPSNIFDVMTPESYPPHINAYFMDNDFYFLGDISAKIYIGKTLPDASEGVTSVLQATSRSCSGLFLKFPMNVVYRPNEGNYLKKKDILLTNAAHDKSYIGRDVSFYHSEKMILPSAKVLTIRLRPNTLPASYVHSYLMTTEGYTQWQSIVRGISAGIHPSDVARIRIPKPKVNNEWNEVERIADDNYIKAGLASQHAMELTISAIQLVDALIESKITEPQLIAAQKALESGDITLDRSILSRLKTDGMDGKGEPLFPDLDRLYELLAQANQEAEA